ncbi:MAG TPA: LysR family transcriptional regulator [Chthoniobacterales bacterium]
MEMREIRSFVVLAEQLHFGRASRLLHLSQPALTKQIHRLEEELGGHLFIRGRHGTKLTALGNQLLRDARPVIQDFDQLIERGRRTARGDLGRLRIGFGFHTFELVPRIVVKLRETTPGIDVSVRDLSTAEQIAALRAEQLDLGFIRLPIGPEFESMPVIQDRAMLVSSSKSPLSESAPLADCKNEPFILISRERSPGFYAHVLKLCAKYGFHPRVVQEASEITTALALVRAGLGLAMIPESFGTTHFSGVRFHRLPDKEAIWKVGAAWRKDDQNPLLKRFLNLLRAELHSDIATNPASQDAL